jgi:preprotein translocase subunit SecG
MVCLYTPATTSAPQRSRLVLNAVLTVIFLIESVLLIVLILIHSGKDAGMASITGFSFASSASVMERNLTRYTIICGVAWFVTSFLLVWRIG